MKTRRSQHVPGFYLETLGFLPIMPKILPRHLSNLLTANDEVMSHNLGSTRTSLLKAALRVSKHSN